MDLNVMIDDSLSQLKEEGYVEKVVRNQLQKTIESVIADTLREYGDFGKALKTRVDDLLQINLDNLDLPSYNHLIVKTIQGHLDAVLHEQGVNRMKEQLDELLLTSKDEYKLSELIKELSEEIDDLDELGFEETHKMTLIIDNESRYTTWIYFDANSNVPKYDCKYRIDVDAKTGQVGSIRFKENQYSGNKAFKEFDTRTIMGGFYGLEKTLFKMYARKSKLVIDEDACELEISNPQYD